MSISFFYDLGGPFLHFSQYSSLRSLGQSSEVEHYPKMSISFFNDLHEVKLTVMSHSEPLGWEEVGKVANWVKLAILSHSEAL